MKNDPKNRTRKRSLALLLSAMVLLLPAQPARALGPNLLGNGSFEGGALGFTRVDRDPYSVVKDPANAHSGAWVVKAGFKMKGWDTSFSPSTPRELWPDTSYTCSVWCKGNGMVKLGVEGLGSATCAATGQWQQITLKFNTGKLDKAVQIYIGTVGGTGSLVYIDDLCLALTDAQTVPFDPEKPSATGFKLIFNDEFNDPNTIDVNCTTDDGYKWYTKGLWFPNTDPSQYEVLASYQGARGVLEIKDGNVAMSWQLSTTYEVDGGNPKTKVPGTIFKTGQGIYYEARIACANLKAIGGNGWPGFWSQDYGYHGFSADTFPMPGWPGHQENIENDIMEYNPTWGHPGQYDSTLHNWHDGGQVASDDNLVCPLGGAPDYTEWHTYGQLWIPATAANGWLGYRQVYFDGRPYQAQCWVGNQVMSSPKPKGSYLFSAHDGTPKSAPRGANLIVAGACSLAKTPSAYFDHVRVYAVDPKASIEVVTKTIVNPPPAPAGVTATGGDAQVALSWVGSGSPSDRATAYKVYRSAVPGGRCETVIAEDIRTGGFIDKGLTNGKTCYYQVVATNSKGTSGVSSEVSAQPAAGGNPAPVGVNLLATQIPASMEEGTNLLKNPGFEDGATGWLPMKPFELSADVANAHGASRALAATISGKPDYNHWHQTVPVVPSTDYAPSLWVRGTGSFLVQIIDGRWQNEKSPLSQLAISATSSWRKVTLPPFNSGENTAVNFLIRNSMSGSPGTVHIDDCYLGVARGQATGLNSFMSYELGMKFTSTKPGKITGVRYYKVAGEGGTHTGRLWSNGKQIACVNFTNESQSGWQSARFADPVSISANTTYVVSVNYNWSWNRAIAATAPGLASVIANGPLSTVADGQNGLYGRPGSLPTETSQNTNYFRDVYFVAEDVR